jgi:hypothetical protein
MSRRAKREAPPKITRVVDGIVLTKWCEDCFWFIYQSENSIPLHKSIRDTSYTSQILAIRAIRGVGGNTA